MNTPQQCPECGTTWVNGVTCTDHFHQMGFWELEYLLYDVHHLMVLSYHIQHPNLYSPDGLAFAITQLTQFLKDGITPQEMRQKISKSVGSDVRKFKIKGTPDSYGKFANPVQWTMTAADVIAGGMDNFYTNVRAWAQSILTVLEASGNL